MCNLVCYFWNKEESKYIACKILELDRIFG